MVLYFVIDYFVKVINKTLSLRQVQHPTQTKAEAQAKQASWEFWTVLLKVLSFGRMDGETAERVPLFKTYYSKVRFTRAILKLINCTYKR